MRKNIIVDIDDTVLHWDSGFREYLDRIGESGNLSTAFAVAFNSSKGFGELKPLDGAVDILKKLKELGHKIYAATSCGDNELTKDLRMKNLNNIFGENFFEKVTFLPFGERKLDFFEGLEDKYNTIVIEDSIKNAKDAMSVGLVCIMIDIDNNIKKIEIENGYYDNVTIGKENWDEILLNIITGNYDK